MEQQKEQNYSSIDSIETRPTLDRVKEALFNIIQNKLEDSIVLDLFAGSGAIGIECISRGATKAYFCEKSHQATRMIYENLDRTRLKDKAIVINKDYEKCLKQLSNDKIKFNIIYIDPPYKANIAVNATEKILLLNLLQKEGIIIIETDEKERELKNLTQIDVEVFRYKKIWESKPYIFKAKGVNQWKYLLYWRHWKIY